MNTKEQIQQKIYSSESFFSEEFPFAIRRCVDDAKEFNLTKRFRRKFWKIVLILSGDGNFVAGDLKFPIQKDSLLVVHPDTCTTYEIHGKEITLFNIVFSRSFLDETIKKIHDKYDFLEVFSPEYHQSDSINLFLLKSDRQIITLIHRIYEEYESCENNRDLLLKLYFMELLLLIVRRSEKKGNRNPAWTAYFAKEYLLHHFREEFSQKELAEKLEISPERLCRIYREFHKCSIMKELQNLRLNCAADLLKTTDLCISEICAQSGYRDLRQFYKMFTQKFSTPPAKYREIMGKN